MQRIALYTTTMAGGGAERVTLLLARCFAERGMCVDLVLVRAQGPYLSEVPSSVRLVDLEARRTVTSVLPLSRYLRRERPSALLSALSPTNCVAVAARFLARAPTVLLLAEHIHVATHYKNSTFRRMKILPRLMRRTYPRADRIVAVSQGVAESLASVGIDRQGITVIPNPIDLELIRAKACDPIIEDWYPGEGRPVVLGAGRLVPQKDFATLIRSFANVRQSRPSRLIILGEGPERGNLQRLVTRLGLEQDVWLPGFVANPFKFMRRSSVFVLSSRWEGLPTVLTEALACGVPVVSTDCPSGPAEILEDGRWGILTPVGDVQALAAAILKGMDVLRERGVERAGAFSPEVIAGLYLNEMGHF